MATYCHCCQKFKVIVAKMTKHNVTFVKWISKCFFTFSYHRCAPNFVNEENIRMVHKNCFQDLQYRLSDFDSDEIIASRCKLISWLDK